MGALLAALPRGCALPLRRQREPLRSGNRQLVGSRQRWWLPVRKHSSWCSVRQRWRQSRRAGRRRGCLPAQGHAVAREGRHQRLWRLAAAAAATAAPMMRTLEALCLWLPRWELRRWVARQQRGRRTLCQRALVRRSATAPSVQVHRRVPPPTPPLHGPPSPLATACPRLPRARRPFRPLARRPGPATPPRRPLPLACQCCCHHSPTL